MIRLKKTQVIVQYLTTGELRVTRKEMFGKKTSAISWETKEGKTIIKRAQARRLTVKELEILWPIQQEINHLTKTTQGEAAQNFDLAKKDLRQKMRPPKKFLEEAKELMDDTDTTEDELAHITLLVNWLTKGYQIVEPAAKRIAELKTILRRVAKAHISKKADDKVEADKLAIRARRRQEKLEEMKMDEELKNMEDEGHEPTVILDDTKDEETKVIKKKKRKKKKAVSNAD